jgi:uncharacterized protein
MLLLKPSSAWAAEATDTFPRIYDDAELLSTSELSDLNSMCISYGNDAGIGIFILTHNDSSSVDGEIYIENFYDSTLYGNYTDSVILLIDMSRRDMVLEGYGTAETYIHSQRGDSLLQDMKPDLSNGDYAAAFETFIKESKAYMKDTSDPNYSRGYTTATENNDYSKQDSILMNIWLQLGISLAIGAIAVGIMAYNAGGRMTVGGNTYIDQGHSGLIGRRDDYIRTTVTRVRKPQNNNSGGGFHGGTSAGGHSHSTSRGSF